MAHAKLRSVLALTVAETREAFASTSLGKLCEISQPQRQGSDCTSVMLRNTPHTTRTVFVKFWPQAFDFCRGYRLDCTKVCHTSSHWSHQRRCLIGHSLKRMMHLCYSWASTAVGNFVSCDYSIIRMLPIMTTGGQIALCYSLVAIGARSHSYSVAKQLLIKSFSQLTLH